MNNKIQRHTWGLREALFQEWEGLRSGKVDARRALASAKIASVILQSVVVEMGYTKQVNETPPDKLTPTTTQVRLGGP